LDTFGIFYQVLRKLSFKYYLPTKSLVELYVPFLIDLSLLLYRSPYSSISTMLTEQAIKIEPRINTPQKHPTPSYYFI